MRVTVVASEPPSVVFSKDGMNASTNFYVTYQAFDPTTGNYTDAFILSSVGGGNIDVDIENQTLVGTFQQLIKSIYVLFTYI